MWPTIVANLRTSAVQSLPLTLIEGHSECPQPLIAAIEGKGRPLSRTATVFTELDMGYRRIGP